MAHLHSRTEEIRHAFRLDGFLSNYQLVNLFMKEGCLPLKLALLVKPLSTMKVTLNELLFALQTDAELSPFVVTLYEPVFVVPYSLTTTSLYVSAKSIPSLKALKRMVTLLDGAEDVKITETLSSGYEVIFPTTERCCLFWRSLDLVQHRNAPIEAKISGRRKPLRKNNRNNRKRRDPIKNKPSISVVKPSKTVNLEYNKEMKKEINSS